MTRGDWSLRNKEELRMLPGRRSLLNRVIKGNVFEYIEFYGLTKKF